MSLADLQRDFNLWLVSGSESVGARLQGATTAGLFVYQNNYRAQLVGCLEASYPQLRTFMGADAFLHAAAAHINKHPPFAWTLDAYADGFDATLMEVLPNNPDIHELAWVEHALGAAFVAGDAQPLGSADFADVDWDAVRLRFTPTLLTRRATTNVADIWWALSDGTRCDGEMLAEPRALMVWRRGFVSCLRTIDTLEYEALEEMRAHGSFAALCEMLIARLGEDAGVARAGGLLADWIGGELITGIDTAP
jgi:hypothetical protein